MSTNYAVCIIALIPDAACLMCYHRAHLEKQQYTKGFFDTYEFAFGKPWVTSTYKGELRQSLRLPEFSFLWLYYSRIISILHSRKV